MFPLRRVSPDSAHERGDFAGNGVARVRGDCSRRQTSGVFILRCTLHYPQLPDGGTRPLLAFALSSRTFLAKFRKARAVREALARSGHGDGEALPVTSSHMGLASLAENADFAWHLWVQGRWGTGRGKVATGGTLSASARGILRRAGEAGRPGAARRIHSCTGAAPRPAGRRRASSCRTVRRPAHVRNHGAKRLRTRRRPHETAGGRVYFFIAFQPTKNVMPTESPSENRSNLLRRAVGDRE